jgi:hypothetical protein
MNSYWPGTAINLTAPFTVAGVATDPTTVTLKVKSPAGTTTTYTYALGEVTKDSVGNYSKVITPTISGAWFYWWAGTGACIATAQAGFQVYEAEF